MFLSLALVLAVQQPAQEWAEDTEVRDSVTGEFPVEEYEQKPANAGAKQFSGDRMAKAFGGQEGIQRIADTTVDLSLIDPRIGDIFKGQDMVRLRRTLFEQFCYILNAGCDYSGRDMKAAHKNLGIQVADLNALVENLQMGMERENIPFRLQNRFLSKLAPMRSDVVER